MPSSSVVAVPGFAPRWRWRQPSKVSKRCQCRMPLVHCASDLGLYTTVDCDKVTQAACHHFPPTEAPARQMWIQL